MPRRHGAVGHALSGERAYEKQVAEAKAKGLPIPKRSAGMSIRQPDEKAEVFDINGASNAVPGKRCRGNDERCAPQDFCPAGFYITENPFRSQRAPRSGQSSRTVFGNRRLRSKFLPWFVIDPKRWRDDLLALLLKAGLALSVLAVC